MSPICFGIHWVIFREESYRFSKPPPYCTVVTTVELQNIKCIICGFIFTELLTIIITILSRSCGLNTSTVCSFKVRGSAVIMCTYFLNDSVLILSNLSPD